ncbi:MAG: hypothetical protein HFG42_17130 [Lachnospiraceae bacterium]|nr:hypothetical protein [Lachnospiraceae bacterium]
MIRHRAIQDLKLLPSQFEALSCVDRAFLSASIIVENNLDGENQEQGGE